MSRIEETESNLETNKSMTSPNHFAAKILANEDTASDGHIKMDFPQMKNTIFLHQKGDDSFANLVSGLTQQGIECLKQRNEVDMSEENAQEKRDQIERDFKAFALMHILAPQGASATPGELVKALKTITDGVVTEFEKTISPGAPTHIKPHPSSVDHSFMNEQEEGKE